MDQVRCGGGSRVPAYILSWFGSGVMEAPNATNHQPEIYELGWGSQRFFSNLYCQLNLTQTGMYAFEGAQNMFGEEAHGTSVYEGPDFQIPLKR